MKTVIHFFILAVLLFLITAIFCVKNYVGKNDNPAIIHVQYTAKNDMLTVSTAKGWEHRNVNSLSMFVKAFNLIRDDISFDFALDINTEDCSEAPLKLAYSRCSTMGGGKNLVPDFTFFGWPEIGIYNYDETCQQIAEAGKKPYQYNKLFWIGNPQKISIRKKLVKKGLHNDNFEFIAMDWNRAEKKDKLSRQAATKYVSLPDHTKYKYLIDVPGYGYSARVKLLLFTNRPLFYVSRVYEEYFMKDLKPFVHYIPVMFDLSDLEEKYQWAERHPDKVQKIAANALAYAEENLTSKAATLRYSDILKEYLLTYHKPKYLP